ncbi:hypothetical protein PEBR_19080 [Penicillium brasilianum]|uniref:Uncharacterized protein n=1 Tax=Penicillium brasilianum TaxID=104259 RepID=A0A1S9RND8_PENBI|nr:hypothetical protein PEBR_19080 [Penicillium brasilianum]
MGLSLWPSIDHKKSDRNRTGATNHWAVLTFTWKISHLDIHLDPAGEGGGHPDRQRTFEISPIGEEGKFC